MKTLDFVLIILALLFISFTTIMLITFWRYGMIPDTLCTCFYGVLFGECGVCGWIKTAKEHARDRKEYLTDLERIKEENDHVS